MPPRVSPRGCFAAAATAAFFHGFRPLLSFPLTFSDHVFVFGNHVAVELIEVQYFVV